MIFSTLIWGGHVEGVNTRTCDAPASLASMQSFLVSRVDWAPVPAMTRVLLKPFSSKVFLVRRMASFLSSCDLFRHLAYQSNRSQRVHTSAELRRLILVQEYRLRPPVILCMRSEPSAHSIKQDRTWASRKMCAWMAGMSRSSFSLKKRTAGT